MKSLSLGLCVVLGLTACGEKDSDEKASASGDGISAGAGKLSLADLAAPSKFAALTRFDVISSMEYNRSDFLANEAEEEVADEIPVEEDDSCFASAMSDVTMTAAGDTLTVDLNINMLSCFQEIWKQEAPTSTVALTQASVSLYMVQTCVGGDLSALNGKGITEIGNIPECDKNLILMNTKGGFAGKVTNEGETFDITSINVSATSTADNEPCTLLRSGNEYMEENGCIEIVKSISADEAEQDYTKYTHKNLKWTASTQNSWYTSGSMDVNLNAWSGSVTFRGADINPLYTMKYGADTINGTLTVPASSLSLKVKALGQDLVRKAMAIKNPR